MEKPKWRFILPYRDAATVATHEKVFAYLQQALGGNLDPRCKTSAQLWYTPACPPDAAHQYEIFTGTGELFDPTVVRQLVGKLPPPKGPSIAKQPDAAHASADAAPRVNLSASEERRVESALPAISSDDRNNWITVGMALKNSYGDAAYDIWKRWSKTSSKYDDDDAESTWESFHPVADGGVTVGTVFHLAKEAGWSPSASTPKPTQEFAPLPLFEIQDARVDRFVQNDAPPRRWLLHNMLPLGKVGMLVAPGGTGKSFLMIQLAVAVATHTRLADHWEVDSPGASLILCAEEDDDDLHHRLRDVLAATIGSSPDLLRLVMERVFIKSMLTENNLMTHANDRREIVPTDYVSRLALTANQIPNLKLIVIDPASRFRGGDEIAAQDTTRFVEALECLRSATGATVLVVHHTNKESVNADDVNQGAARGSSALTDGVRFQMNLNKPTKLQAKSLGVPEDRRHEHVLATITKNNGAPPQRPVLLKRGPGGVLAVDAMSKPRLSGEEKLLELIKVEAAAGRTYTANSLEVKFSGATEASGLSSAAFRRLTITCVNLGYLRKRTSKPVGTLELTGKTPK
jgi:hypothetical protein